MTSFIDHNTEVFSNKKTPTAFTYGGTRSSAAGPSSVGGSSLTVGHYRFNLARVSSVLG